MENYGYVIEKIEQVEKVKNTTYNIVLGYNAKIDEYVTWLLVEDGCQREPYFANGNYFSTYKEAIKDFYRRCHKWADMYL